MASSHLKEVLMGDKSPKSKQRDKKQKNAAKVRADQKKQQQRPQRAGDEKSKK
jgi:hypothetical protein